MWEPEEECSRRGRGICRGPEGGEPWVCEEQQDCGGDRMHGAERAVSDHGEVPGLRSVGPTGLDPTGDVATRGCQQSDVMRLLFIRLALTTPQRLDYEGEEARAGTGSERTGP